MFTFTVEAVDSETGARAGRFETPHGPVLTPAFMPVGTQATVKSLDPTELHALGAQMVLANTYHLSLRPGAETVARLGGLHRFMAWDGPLLTNSGGFQVFSLAHLRRLDEDGVTFRSHIDGSERRLTPEVAIRAQEQLGADVIMAFDECLEAPATYERTREALDRTHRWAERCRRAHTRPDQALFGIVQGGLFDDLRLEGARAIGALDFPGYAIGGVSVGESKADCWRVSSLVAPLLPAGRPRYLMGVGSPEDLAQGVGAGIDLFDCVLPTRLARNGTVLTDAGRESLVRSRWRETEGPFDLLLRLLHLRPLLRRLPAPSLPGPGAAGPSPGQRAQPALHGPPLGPHAPGDPGAALRRLAGGLPGRLPRGGRGPAPGAALEAPRRLGEAPRRPGRARSRRGRAAGEGQGGQR